MTPREKTELALELYFQGGWLSSSSGSGVSIAHVVQENGRVGKAKAVDHHGEPCRACNGSGYYRRRASFHNGRRLNDAAWGCPSRVSEDYDPTFELGWCVACRHTGVGVAYSAKPVAETRDFLPPAMMEVSSGVPAILGKCSEQTQRMLAVAFSERPRWLRSQPRSMLLWPHIGLGRDLLKHWTLKDLCRIPKSTDPIVKSALRLLHVQATALLEEALLDFESHA